MPTALKFSDQTPAFWGLYVKKISQAVCILEITKCRIKRKDDCSVFNLKYVYILIVDRLENLNNSCNWFRLLSIITFYPNTGERGFMQRILFGRHSHETVVPLFSDCQNMVIAFISEIKHEEFVKLKRKVAHRRKALHMTCRKALERS